MWWMVQTWTGVVHHFDISLEQKQHSSSSHKQKRTLAAAPGSLDEGPRLRGRGRHVEMAGDPWGERLQKRQPFFMDKMNNWWFCSWRMDDLVVFLVAKKSCPYCNYWFRQSEFPEKTYIKSRYQSQADNFQIWDCSSLHIKLTCGCRFSCLISINAAQLSDFERQFELMWNWWGASRSCREGWQTATWVEHEHVETWVPQTPLIFQVQLLRPLLHRRKSDFIQLLEDFPTPHFRDSTPGVPTSRWKTRREWTSGFDQVTNWQKQHVLGALQTCWPGVLLYFFLQNRPEMVPILEVGQCVVLLAQLWIHFPPWPVSSWCRTCNPLAVAEMKTVSFP